MVLNPENVLPAEAPACGIGLNIPVTTQLETIATAMPHVRRLGLLYDPANNTPFFEAAGRAAVQRNVELVPLKVGARKEIPGILKAGWPRIDALWLIPDRTVISETLVRYVIKEALLQGRPVVGYNRYFYDSGAALAFIFDYAELGAQTGRLALATLRGGACGSVPPGFHAWLNARVLEKIGIPTPAAPAAPLEIGP